MEINSTTAQAAKSSALPVPEPETKEASALSSDFETFLRMLTVQMQNQDPLNPIQSADFAVQLATFSGVEQQVRTNDLLAAMAGQQSFSGLSQVADWVGMEARAPVAARWNGTPVTLYPEMPFGADQATLITRNDAGEEMARIAIPVSSEPIQWVGSDSSGATLPDGFYSFEIETRQDGKLIATEPVDTYARITEARLVDGDPVIVFASGETLEANDVTAVRLPQL
jgi:flagellar basal-body rod modification protein FlgD